MLFVSYLYDYVIVSSTTHAASAHLHPKEYKVSASPTCFIWLVYVYMDKPTQRYRPSHGREIFMLQLDLHIYTNTYTCVCPNMHITYHIKILSA